MARDVTIADTAVPVIDGQPLGTRNTKGLQMSASPGWYPTGDGTFRYWDGNQWIEHPQPETASGGATDAGLVGVSGEVAEPAEGRTRSVPVSAWLGWSALFLVAVLGAATSGVSGLAILSGLFVAVVAVVALIRGRVRWAHLRSRAAGGAALAAAVALFAVGGATADPQPSPAAPGIASASSTSQSAPASAPAATATPTTGTSSAAVTSKAPAPRPQAPAPAPAPAKGTALAAVADLTVKGRAAKTGYSRDQFGQAWFDTDRNGCDTRNDMLRRDLVDRTMKNSCKVLAGTLAPDPYTGTIIRFEYGGASEVDLDHVVALSDSWQKGAASWAAGKRLAFGNDPLNLLAVDASTNRAKGDGDTATWLPPNKSFRCEYVARQVSVKRKYGLSVTAAEKVAMVRVLSACPAEPLPAAGPAPTTAQLPRPAPQPTPKPTVAPKPPAVPKPPPADVYYANCDAVRAAGAAPIYRGQPGYSSKLDRDGDGVGCEK